MALKSTVSNGNHDAVSAIEQAESRRGNDGVPWVGGNNAGGSSQVPIKVVSDVTQAGYNLLNSRSVGTTGAINQSQCAGNLVCQTWKSPEEAADFAVRVLGETAHQTCDGCTKTQTTPGVGLTPIIQEEYEIKLQALQDLVTGAKPTTFENLQAASSNSLPVTRGVIEALRNEPDLDLMVRGHVYTDYGGQIDRTLPNEFARAAGVVGTSLGATAYFPGMDVMRQALPIVLSFLKMAIVICIPLILVVGAYDLKTVVTVSCVEFALFFVDFWFQLARWIDSTILNALYSWDSPHSNINMFMGLDNAFGDMLLNFVMAMMFIVLPGFWIAALGWVGVKAGNVAQMMTLSTGDAKNAGSQVGGALTKAGGTVAGGMSEGMKG